MSCLFESIGRCIGKSADQVRHEVCEYLLENPDVMGEDEEKDAVCCWLPEGVSLAEYVDQMRRSDTWGTAVEIKAFVDMYGRRVTVYDTRCQPPRKIRFYPRHRPPHLPCIRLSWDGGHYETM